jgi:hypothetical protein
MNGLRCWIMKSDFSIWRLGNGKTRLVMNEAVLS